MILHNLKLLQRQLTAGCRCHGTHASLNILHGHIHTRQITNRVKGLRQIQTLRRRLLATHTVDIGITRGLQER